MLKVLAGALYLRCHLNSQGNLEPFESIHVFGPSDHPINNVHVFRASSGVVLLHI